MPAAGDARRLVGRDDLTHQLADHLGLDEAANGVASVALLGAAGIGKTALWEWSVQSAQAAGWPVLIARCSAAETGLPWVGITDLLSGCDPHLIEALPPPQRQAIEIVTLRADVVDAPPDDRSVGTAIAALLTAIASSGPLLVAIDDAAVLDPTSERALRFALRRVDQDLPLRVLVTAREAGGDLLDRLPRCTVMTPGPLSVGAVYHLLRQHLGLTFGRPTLVRIHDTSEGNPLYALELARALNAHEIVDAAGRPLALPGALQGLLVGRLQRAPADVRRVVAMAAAAWRLPSAAVDADALMRAREDGLVQTRRDLVEPAHPLLGSAAYSVLTDSERLELHLALSEATADPVERARHLAVATPQPDPSVASLLDDAAAQAQARGAAEAAAELARLAVEHTPPGAAEAASRYGTLADLLLRTGDTAGSEKVQREAVAAAVPGPARSRQLIRLAEIVVETEGWKAGCRVAEQAVVEAGDDAQLAAEAHLTLSAVTYDDIPASDRHAARAVELLSTLPDPDPRILVGTLTQSAGARFRAGRGLDREMFGRAVAIEREHPSRRLSDRADASYAALLKYADDLDAAEAIFRELLIEAEASGDQSSVSYVLAHLPQLELWRGDFAAARRYVEAHQAVSESADLGSQLNQVPFLTGLVAAHDGRAAEARRILEGDLAVREVKGDLWDQQRLQGALGFLAWSEADAARAGSHLARWDEMLTEIGLHEPGYSRYHRDHVEVLVASGQLDEAAQFLDRLATQAERTGRASARAVVDVGRGLLCAAHGEDEAARAHMAAALEVHETVPLRFDRARTLWATGQVHRRAKAKTLARAALQEARSEFSAMGAALWVERADAELARVNIRPGAPTELTASERRVAELVASGMTNRQVAATMFLSAKTVEANLSRVYRKLGVRSRAELGARFGPGHGPLDDAAPSQGASDHGA